MLRCHCLTITHHLHFTLAQKCDLAGDGTRITKMVGHHHNSALPLTG
ncbi:Uncharacterised protein [Vibrio cholerae]|uniref:Uncharacterized protein n=1 Tax=Vibrio cholerae TaxID=666 RepID=A0A655ZCK1_VIBCL|nr:Uncharacterised protein [Vibrio cholerae]CSA31162.1 Uncharacterised protein [Vibrio cholerae]CSA81387.1 Uncharacterised protein [Vibrio cholerae]CSA89400.1 Uncharacterised protein [Vibrio cholerae]CSA96581.1 Uncharacterised protein [Vibrio cholerae]